MKIQKILATTDFSSSAQAALDFAVELSGRLDASLTVLHVYQTPQPPIPSYPAPAPSPIAELAQLLEEVDRALETLRREIRQRGGPQVSTLAVDGTPVVEILRQAHDGGYDLLVIGTHGRGGLRHALLGSVAEQVVHGAPCPVLTVRTLQESREVYAP